MKKILAQSPIIAVITLHEVSHAVPIAQALLAGGVKTLEIVLRTPAALPGIKEISQALPELNLGAGTIVHCNQIEKCQKAGVKFLVSPGVSHEVLKETQRTHIPLLPGISTVTEIMQVLDYHIDIIKFFPAVAFGGVNTLKAYGAVFPSVKFCPTGGITLDTLTLFHDLPNVAAVGGSWLAPTELAQQQNWAAITQLAKQALAKLQ